METMFRRRIIIVLSYFYLLANHVLAQQAPAAPEHPWQTADAHQFESSVSRTLPPPPLIDQAKIYTLAELIDLAEAQNPDTRVAWQNARAQAANLGLARSELYPMLAAAASSQFNRQDVFFATAFYPQNAQEFDGRLELSYLVFDFGGRSGRIAAAKAGVFASNFAFNDSHRRVIFAVEQSYYQLLNASGQLQAAQTNLATAQEINRSASFRLQHGLATLPDQLEAQSALAQADFDLQSAVGLNEIAKGNLARAVGSIPSPILRIQSLDDLGEPAAFSDTIDTLFTRAFKQRPDLMQRFAEAQAAETRIKEARAAYYPSLNLNAWGGGQAFYASQQALPWEHTRDFAGGVGVNLSWDIFDFGARKSRLAQARADAAASQASVEAVRDAIADEVWTAYSNVKTAYGQRRAAAAFLASASQSYQAVLDSYNHGVRSFLDVAAAQRILAQARSADVFARTQVLTALAELAFRTGDMNRPAKRTP